MPIATDPQDSSTAPGVLGVPRARQALAAAALATLFAAPPAMAGPEAPPGDGAEIVSARAVTDATTIAPGEPFLAGVELTLADGWHVYWQNPGDAGLSTDLTFDLPEGFHVGPVRYPVPEVFEQPGEIVGYGYSHAVRLVAEITPPPTFTAGDLSFDVTADWLSCAHVCIPGRATRTLTIPTGSTSVRRLDAAPWSDEWPLGAEATSRPFVDTMSVNRTGPDAADVVVLLEWQSEPPHDIAWIPDPPDEIELTNVSLHTEGRLTRVAFEAGLLAGASTEAEIMETVVAYATPDGDRRGVLVPVGLQLFGATAN